ncbi:hypothetical protein ACWD0J_20335 [Streptomyces sp. NPDC003011]
MSGEEPGPQALSQDVPTREFWWLHDARWYQGVLKRFGPEAANEINAEAVAFVARRLALWYTRKNGVKFGELRMDEFVEWFEGIPAAMWTDAMMEVQQIPCGEDEWETVVTKNFALKMLRVARALDGYACPCLDMRAGWFQGMGITVRDSLVECQRTGSEVCRFHATIVRQVPEIRQKDG